MYAPANALLPEASVSPLAHSFESPLAAIVRRSQRVAQSEATVLVTGETGTGKEVMARFLHQSSPRAERNFVAVNCGAIPEALLESELFGYVKGAFTGAVINRRGRVSLAEGGTLFLDEIGELPLSMQVKLLRLLQEKTYEPVGSADTVQANFRLIAATNRDLAAEVEAGRFRRDLYYRLMVCPIELPALRHRRADVPILFRHFWAQLGETRPVDDRLFEALAKYEWRGNVRELENLAERLSVCTESPSILPEHLPSEFRGAAAPSALTRVPFVTATTTPPPIQPRGAVRFDIPAPDALLNAPVDLPALLRELESGYITAALAAARGSKKGAADLLGLQRTTLVEKLRRRDGRPGSSVSLAAVGS